MDIVIFMCIFQCLLAVEAQSTVKDSRGSSKTIENRLLVLEEENRRLGQTLQGMH